MSYVPWNVYLEEVDPLTEFLDGIKSKSTKNRYIARFDLFLRNIGMEGHNREYQGTF